jgi:hypothetical protein
MAGDLLSEEVVIGRSFESMGMSVKDVSARWLRASMSSRKKLPVCKGKKPCGDG